MLIGSLELNYLQAKKCLPITGETIGDIIEQSRTIKSLDFDAVEFRAAYFSGVINLSQLWNAMITVSLQFPEHPLIFSLKAAIEPSEHLSEKNYFDALLFAVKTALCDAIEIDDCHDQSELENVLEYANEMGLTTIYSHNFSEKKFISEKFDSIINQLLVYKTPFIRLYTPFFDDDSLAKMDQFLQEYRKSSSNPLFLTDSKASPLFFHSKIE